MDGTLIELGNGKYRCRISFTNENGKRIQRSKTYTAAGKKEARQLMRNFKDECQKNNISQTLITLNNLYESFKKYHYPNIQELTRETYDKSWNKLSLYHGRKINTIKPNVIKDMLNVAEKDSRSQKGVYQLLTAMYSYAINSELLTYNPTTNVKSPKYEPPEKKILSDAQKQTLNSLIDTQLKKYQVIYYMTLTLGFRRQEICALKWSDIDFDNKMLYIKRVAVALKGQGTIVKEKGKTDKSISPLPLSDKHIKILKEYKAYTLDETKKKKIDTEYLFFQNNGNVINVHSVSKWFKYFCNVCGVEGVTFHSLRHTCATNLLQNGVDLATVAAILRDSIETVAKTYLHTDENIIREAIEKLA